MFLIIAVMMVLIAVTPLTLEVKVVSKERGCRHVLVTSWFGYIKHIDADVCGADKLPLEGKTIGGTVQPDQGMKD